MLVLGCFCSGACVFRVRASISEHVCVSPDLRGVDDGDVEIDVPAQRELVHGRHGGEAGEGDVEGRRGSGHGLVLLAALQQRRLRLHALLLLPLDLVRHLLRAGRKAGGTEGQEWVIRCRVHGQNDELKVINGSSMLG